MFFPYFSLSLSRLFFFFFYYSASAQSATYKRKEELIFFYFLIANNHFTLNESFCFYLMFFLALSNSVHPKILTRFYSIYFKIPRKISAQSDG